MINLIPKQLLLTLAIIAAVIVVISLFNFYMAINPGKWPVYFTPESLGLEYEGVEFKTSDNLKLKGWFLPGKKGNDTIIVMHGYPTNKADVLPFSTFLLSRYNVFLFDFRSFGESEGKYTTAGYKEVKDLDAAVDYLTSRKGTGNIGALGFSLGGAVALMNSNQDIKAVVVDSTYSNLNNMIMRMYENFYFLKYPFVYLTRFYGKIAFGVDPKDVSPANSIRNKGTPILIIHGRKDRQIPVEEAHILHGFNNKSKLWIVGEADHGSTYALNKREYEKRVFEFFEKHLKEQ